MGAQKYKPNRDIYCCSISTIGRSATLMAQLIQECSIFIIDEAHNATSTQYQNLLSAVPEHKYVIGLTATPFRIGKHGHTFWDDIIHPISTLELIEQGYLVKPRVFGPPAMSTEGVKTTGGDYNSAQLFKKNNDMVIYGDIIKSWRELANNKKTLCFAINKEHAMTLKNIFIDNGIPAAYADAETSQEERIKLFNQLASGEIKVLTNCNIASTGVDIPEVECVLSARPTKSRVLWIQQVGRALRLAPNKNEAIIIDHGGNCDRLGHPLMDFDAETTDKTPGEKEKKPISLKTCPKCFYKTMPTASTCLSCGHVFTKVEREIEQVKNIKLSEKQIPTTEWAKQYLKPDCPEDIKKYSETIAKQITLKNHKKNSYFFKMYDKFGHTPHIRFPQWFIKIKINTQDTKNLPDPLSLTYSGRSLNQGFSSDT